MRVRRSWAAYQEQMHQHLAARCVKKEPCPGQIYTSLTGADPMFFATSKRCTEHRRGETFFNSRLAFLSQNPQGYGTDQHIDSGCGRKSIRSSQEIAQEQIGEINTMEKKSNEEELKLVWLRLANQPDMLKKMLT